MSLILFIFSFLFLIFTKIFKLISERDLLDFGLKSYIYRTAKTSGSWLHSQKLQIYIFSHTTSINNVFPVLCLLRFGNKFSSRNWQRRKWIFISCLICSNFVFNSRFPRSILFIKSLIFQRLTNSPKVRFRLSIICCDEYQSLISSKIAPLRKLQNSACIEVVPLMSPNIVKIWRMLHHTMSEL